MLRRWLADQTRLALRKVLPRVVAFAFFPTRKEMDQIFAGVMAEVLAATNTPAPAIDRPRQNTRLH